jgi:hypothetical protein
MPDTWLRFSKRFVDVSRVVAVEDGVFDQAAQRFRAVLLFDGGASRPLDVEYVEDVVEQLRASGSWREPLLRALEAVAEDKPTALRTCVDAIGAVLESIPEDRERRRRATTSAPPAPDLARPMTYVDAITLARQFLALHEMPEPDQLAWLSLNAKTGLALASELVRLFERHPEGTPIAGAGCE